MLQTYNRYVYGFTACTVCLSLSLSCPLTFLCNFTSFFNHFVYAKWSAHYFFFSVLRIGAVQYHRGGSLRNHWRQASAKSASDSIHVQLIFVVFIESTCCVCALLVEFVCLIFVYFLHFDRKKWQRANEIIIIEENLLAHLLLTGIEHTHCKF